MHTPPLRYQNFANVLTGQVKATAGVVYSLSCHNSNAAVRYIQLFDTVTAPTSTTTVPYMSFAIPAVSQVIIGVDLFTSQGFPFTTGIYWAYSTTRDVYTAATGAEQHLTLFYV